MGKRVKLTKICNDVYIAVSCCHLQDQHCQMLKERWQTWKGVSWESLLAKVLEDTYNLTCDDRNMSPKVLWLPLTFELTLDMGQNTEKVLLNLSSGGDSHLKEAVEGRALIESCDVSGVPSDLQWTDKELGRRSQGHSSVTDRLQITCSKVGGSRRTETIL